MFGGGGGGTGGGVPCKGSVSVPVDTSELRTWSPFEEGILHAQPAPRVSKPGGQRVGKRVGAAVYPTWRAGSIFWRSAQNKAYFAVFAVQVSVHFAWHSSISAAPNILVFSNFAEFRRLVGPLADSGGRLHARRGGGGGGVAHSFGGG